MTAPDFGNALLRRIEGEIIESRTGQRLGGRRLKSAIAICARSFREAAGQSQGPLLLALELTLESVVAYLGAMASGRTVVPVDAKEWQQRGGEIIEMLRPAVCWFPLRLKQVAPQANRSGIVRGVALVIDQAEEHDHVLPETGPGDEDDLFAQARLLVPTSGSTGRPSLVRVTDPNLLANTRDIVDSQGLSSRDKALLCLPLNYCFGASVLHSHLWAGGSVVVDDRMMFSEKILDAMVAEGCTTFAGVPTSFLFLHTHSTVLQRKFPDMRLWLQAGGYLSATVVKAFRSAHPEIAFAVMYGQTEATARIAAFVADGDYPRGCVGYPMNSLEVEIRSEGGSVCAVGEEGDIWIHGASVCAGYFRDPEREAEKFVDGWLNTGDIGHLLLDGRLCITGRSDGFIKVRGRRVSSLEIEDAVWRALAVRSCACAIPDPTSGEAIGLFLESHPGGTENGSSGEWAVRLRRSLPQHWDLGPVICGVLPFTSSGKINRRACFTQLAKAGEGSC